ncbi:MAG: AAA family ATPase [Candidatus Thorarchaeota archaeon]|nr:MAG: AAA family ATPase [Candidatus Thorarchaeota archaeon]
MGDNQVYIESVRLKNFLSFYEGFVELDSGLTVIVGPNGSGKTSIFQALKFALGSNQREDRYPKWSDFIRHGASAAEVEVRVKVNGQSRKLTRRIGKGSIPRPYIDGRRVKAAELRELVSSFGFDVDNDLVFMPQEKINSIRGMNPVAVRTLIEEGTGLYALRDRISLEETRVARSRQELDNALIESQAVETELRFIKRDLQRLEKKRELQKRESELEVEAKWARRQELNGQVESIRKEVEERESGLLEILDQSKSLQDELESDEEDASAIQKRIDSIQVEIGRIGAKIEAEKRRIDHLREEDKKLIGELSKTEDLLKKDRKQLDKIGSDLKRASVQKEERLERLKTLRQSFAELETERAEIEAALERFSKWNKKRAEAYGTYKGLQADIRSRDFLVRSLMERLQVEQAELHSMERRWESTWQALEKTDERELNQRLAGIEREIESVNEERIRAGSKLSEIRKRMEKTKLKLSEMKERIPASVHELKSSIEDHELASVAGPLIELIPSGEKFGEVLEILFSDNMVFAFIVTESADFSLMQKLRDQVSAPSPIILVSDDNPGRVLPELPKGRGVEGWLWETLELEPETRRILRLAFGEYVLTSTAAACTRVSTKTGLNAVSLDRHIHSHQNKSIVSHPLREPTGIISSAPLQAQLASAEAEAKVVNKQITNAALRLEALVDERSEILDMLSQFRAWSETWHRRKRLSESIVELQERIASGDQELKELQKDLGIAERKLKKLDDAQPPERSRLIAAQNAVRTKQRSLQSDLSSVEAALAASEAEEENRKGESARLKESIAMLSERATDLRSQVKESESIAAEAMTTIEGFAESQVELEDELERLRSDLESRRDLIRLQRENLVEINLRIKDSHRLVAQTKKQLTSLEQETQRIESELNLDEQPESVRDPKSVYEELVGIRHVLEDYRDVSEAIALTESQLSNRFASLIVKSAELGLELEEAELAVKSIREQYHNEMSDAISGVENQVNNILNGVQFPGDVRFELLLKDGQYGVEFKSRIKAEAFVELSAGSGGERSLIAIALILALQKLNSNPIYALDEIDIFLDATNTELVGKLLHNSSLSSQFVLFTPAKSTYLLRNADRIIGVAAPRGSEPSLIIENPRFSG